MSYFSDRGLPELYNWALSTGVIALILIVAALVLLIWSLLRLQKKWRFSLLFLLLLGIGIWSLLVALIGFQQLNDFEDRLFRPAHLTLAYVNSVLGTAYAADIQRCQIQFGITLALLALLTIVGIWCLIVHFMREDSIRSEITDSRAEESKEGRTAERKVHTRWWHFAGYALLALLLVGGCIFGLETSSGRGISAAQAAAPVLLTPDDSNGVPSMNITYSTPTVPPAISKEQAIQIALNSIFAQGTGATSSTRTYARYVILHQNGSVFNGKANPSFPAWVITFEGVNVSGHGQDDHFNHELYIVVNAQTGEVEFSFSYR